MYDEIIYDIFISPSLKDEKWVTSFAKKLCDCGLNVFIFEKDIKDISNIDDYMK